MKVRTYTFLVFGDRFIFLFLLLLLSNSTPLQFIFLTYSVPIVCFEILFSFILWSLLCITICLISSSNSSSFIWSHGSLHTHSPIHFHLIILSTFFTFNFIYLHSLIFYQSSLVSIKLHFLPFQASFITKPSQHHSFPDSPLSDLFLTRQAARLSVYYVFIISVSFLFNKHWNMAAERLHTLSQDFYLSDDLISFLECLTWWVPLGESPLWSRRPYSKCFELLRQVRYPLISHSGSLHLFGRS